MLLLAVLKPGHRRFLLLTLVVFTDSPNTWRRHNQRNLMNLLRSLAMVRLEYTTIITITIGLP
jgi:hypothetical protein